MLSGQKLHWAEKKHGPNETALNKYKGKDYWNEQIDWRQVKVLFCFLRTQIVIFCQFLIFYGKFGLDNKPHISHNTDFDFEQYISARVTYTNLFGPSQKDGKHQSTPKPRLASYSSASTHSLNATSLLPNIEQHVEKYTKNGLCEWICNACRSHHRWCRAIYLDQLATILTLVMATHLVIGHPVFLPDSDSVSEKAVVDCRELSNIFNKKGPGLPAVRKNTANRCAVRPPFNEVLALQMSEVRDNYEV